MDSGLVPRPSESDQNLISGLEDAVEKWQRLTNAILQPNLLDNWIENPVHNDDCGILRDLFTQSRKAEFLVALSILCQGFLAVFAEKRGDEWGPAEINGALMDMGFPDYATRLGPDTDELGISTASKADVSKPSWWLEAFPMSRTQVETTISREWGAADFTSCAVELRSLLSEIYSGGPISPGLVAKAYCSIDKKLRGR